MADSGGSLRELLALLGPHRRGLLLAVLLSPGAIIGVVVAPLLIGDAVNKISAGDRSGLVRSALALVGVAILAAVSQGARQRRGSRGGQRGVRAAQPVLRSPPLARSARASDPVGRPAGLSRDRRHEQIPTSSGRASPRWRRIRHGLLPAVVMFISNPTSPRSRLAPVPLIVVSVVPLSAGGGSPAEGDSPADRGASG